MIIERLEQDYNAANVFKGLNFPTHSYMLIFIHFEMWIAAEINWIKMSWFYKTLIYTLKT